MSDRIYKGSCSNLKLRLLNHNSGDVRSTKSYRPWKLIYYEAFENKIDALREEKFLKTGKGRERVRYLIS